jgi:hypothetical protein
MQRDRTDKGEAMRFKLVRYVAAPLWMAPLFALERPDGTLERTSGPGSDIKTFDHPRDAFRYVERESGGDPSYCVTWEGTTY